MANVNIVLGPRGAGMADMPVPAAVYVSQEKKDVTTVSDSSITVPAASNDLFWFVTSGPRHFCQAFVQYDFAVQPGDKIQGVAA